MSRLSLTLGWAWMGDGLLRTDDAGATWFDITPAELPDCAQLDGCLYPAFSPWFLDASHGWLVMIEGQEDAPPTVLSIIRTEDGGRSWAAYEVARFSDPSFCPGPACIIVDDIDFVDPQRGWLAAHAAEGMNTDIHLLYRTRDGGRTWTSLEMPVVGTITFIDASTGWATGGESHWTTDRLLRTRDGGASWEPVSLPLPQGYDEPGYFAFNEPVFLSHEVGVIPVQFNAVDVGAFAIGFYVTQDGGLTWTPAATLEEPKLQDISLPWSAIDETTWYVAASRDHQYFTRDGGRTWETFPAVGLGDVVLWDVQFVSEEEGWALGMTCNPEGECSEPMFVTHDGGRTWTSITPGP
jgi:photosystem II stability/assembly factor-like uncharacterized protein